MEIENLEVIPFDQIGKEPEPKKEETTAEKEPKKPEVTSDEGLIAFDDIVKVQEENKTETTEPKKVETENTNVLSKTLKALYEKEGLEFNEEEFDGTIESYLSLQEELSDKKAQVKLDSHIQNNLNPLNKKFIELVDSGVPVEDAADLMKSLKTITEIKKSDIASDLELAEKIQKEYLRTKNFSPEKIAKEIKKSKEAGVLMEEAEENYDELVASVTEYETELKQEVARQTQAQQAQAQKQLQDLQDFIESTEEIGGIKLSKKLKESWVKEYQTVEANGQKVNPIFATRQKDEAKFDALLRFYHTIGLFKYDARKKDFIPDLSVLKNVGKADVIKELEQAITNNNQKSINKSFATTSTDTMEQVINDGYAKLAEAVKNKKIK